MTLRYSSPFFPSQFSRLECLGQKFWFLRQAQVLLLANLSLSPKPFLYVLFSYIYIRCALELTQNRQQYLGTPYTTPPRHRAGPLSSFDRSVPERLRPAKVSFTRTFNNNAADKYH